MRDRYKLYLMAISIPLLFILQSYKLLYSDWLSMILCYVGLVLILGSFTFLPEVYRVSKWPSVMGKIVTSNIGSRDSESTERRIYANIEYLYSVNEVEYRAKRFKLGVQDIVDSSEHWVNETLAKYPVNNEVQVFYNPHKPSDATLDRGLNIRIFGFTLLGILFYLIGLAVGWIIQISIAGVY